MRVRFFVFFLMFLFVGFSLYSATTNQQDSNSGSGTLGKPSVKFKEWQIGRSDRNTDSNNFTRPDVQKN